VSGGRLAEFDEEVSRVAHADATMWSTLRSARRPTLPRGCEIILLEIFRGAMILTALDAAAGWTVSRPANVSPIGPDLSTPKGLVALDQRVGGGDPFHVAISRLCSVGRMRSVQQEHPALFGWVRKLVRERVDKGRLVLIEGDWLSDHGIGPICHQFGVIIDDIVGYPDAIEDAIFAHAQCDRCVIGDTDWDSGSPLQTSTSWGASSACLANALSAKFGGSHARRIQGDRWGGRRSGFKAAWPEDLCSAVLDAIVDEARNRTATTAYPAQKLTEVAEEKGPIDGVDGF
jgi:hypothetical protein